jgi:hypothetical protein
MKTTLEKFDEINDKFIELIETSLRDYEQEDLSYILQNYQNFNSAFTHSTYSRKQVEDNSKIK